MNPPQEQFSDKLSTLEDHAHFSVDGVDYESYPADNIEAVVSIVVPIIFGIIVVVGLFGELYSFIC